MRGVRLLPIIAVFAVAFAYVEAAISNVRPSSFPWPLFAAGFAVMSWAGLRVTWPWRSRLLAT